MATKRKAVSNTKKIGGKTMTRKACSKSKNVIKKKAVALRKAGGTARVVKSTTGYCLFVGPKSKVKKAKKK